MIRRSADDEVQTRSVGDLTHLLRRIGRKGGRELHQRDEFAAIALAVGGERPFRERLHRRVVELPGVLAPAQELTPEQRAEVAALREGDMRKLTFLDAPQPAPAVLFVRDIDLVRDVELRDAAAYAYSELSESDRRASAVPLKLGLVTAQSIALLDALG